MKFQQFSFYTLIFFLLGWSGCVPGEPVELTPVAKFSTPLIEFGVVTFKNRSINATEYLWDFGDGNTSTEQDPVYEYQEIGNLTAGDGTQSDETSAIVPISKIFPDNLFELDLFPGGEIAEALHFVSNGKAYVGGGGDNFVFGKKMWEFDPVDQTWTLKNEMPREFNRGVSFVINDVAYFGLGQMPWGSASYEFFAYNSQTDSYIFETDFPIQNTNQQPNIDATAFAFDGKGYVIGGSSNFDKSIWQYDPVAKNWTDVGDYPGNANSGMYCFVLGEKVYIGLGNKNTYSNFDNENDFWEYEVSNNSWTKLNDFPGKDRRDGIGFTYNGKGYIGFGWRADLNTGAAENFADLWEYDPASDEWKIIENLPVNAGHHPFGFMLGDSFYFGGGSNGGSSGSDNFFEYQF